MSRNLKTFSIKNDREKCSIKRLNVPSEVECWALNTEMIVNKIDYTDKFDTLDDKYLAEFDDSDEKAKKIDPIVRKMQIIEALRKVKSKKQKKKELSSEFDDILTNIMSANFENLALDPSFKEEKTSPMFKAEKTQKKKDLDFDKLVYQISREQKLEKLQDLFSGMPRFVNFFLL